MLIVDKLDEHPRVRCHLGQPSSSRIRSHLRSGKTFVSGFQNGKQIGRSGTLHAVTGLGRSVGIFPVFSVEPLSLEELVSMLR